MASHHISAADLKPATPFVVSSTVRTGLIGAAVVGLGLFGLGLAVDPQRAWASFLHNHFFFMSLGLGGLFFAAIQWMTSAMWSVTIRRVSESLTAYLPIALLTFGVVALGIHDLYVWSHPEHVKGDIILEGKSGYLSSVFFILRNVFAVGVWIFFSKKLIGNSLAQDTSKDASLTLKNRSMAPLFLITFGLTFTMASFDQLMSLDPHWFSTMFGVYCFAGLFYSTLALTAVLTVSLKRKGALDGYVNENHLHDLGKFMFAFTAFWAYIGFSQYMLIWYANMPEETGYFLHREVGSWLYVGIFLMIGKFAVPFFTLLPRENKRSEKVLFGVGIWMLICQWIDILWVVQPEFFKDGPRVSWIELGTLLGFAGLFGTMVVRFWSKHTVVAVGDPRLTESLNHHQ